MASQSDDPYAGLSDKAREECLRRMCKTLEKPPRHRKTREYVASLTGPRETPEELRSRAEAAVERARKQAERADKQQQAKAIARKVVDAAISQGTRVPFTRKDRVAFVRKHRAAPPEKARPQSFTPKRNCREGPRQNFGLRGPEKGDPRDMNATRALRAVIARAQNDLCALCGEKLPTPIYRATLDHVIPRSRGGIDGLGNYVVAHGLCNTEKANDIPTGCEMIWLLMVNAKLGVLPTVF